MSSGDSRPVLPAGAPAAAHWPWRYARVPRPDGYDELFDEGGRPRPHWERIVGMFEGLGLEELRHRWDQAKRLLREHGVSYDAYGDPGGVARPWNLSPIPMVIGAGAWSEIAAGLAQRARLLDLVAADLYGPQRLFARCDLPPELAFAHPGFLRPCAGIVPAGGRYLPLYSADLVRVKDGRLHVLADRTQAPSGVGYALENRIVLSRSLSEVFRDCGVARLATFFRTLRGTLRDLAPHNRDNPRIVLLTPGPYNATYFEQAFLAQYLDLTLARSDDLVVRDRRVCLKTLGGLRPIDVILRRVNDDFCDPLELRPDSSLGVPGLVEAVRSGNVAVANPLGSGVLQTAAIMPFLPALCRNLLGEDLKIPSVPTYWCGDAEALSYVEGHLAELVIKPAFPVGPTAPVFGPELTRAELDALRARIRAQPRDFVAQECVVLSMVPSLSHDELSPAHLWMRAYLVATGDGYEAMPGALSRVGRPGESIALSLRPGGESKDTWVLAGGPVSTFSLLPPPTAPVELSRGGGDLPSRVADNLFWLGRYAERTEATARLARAVAIRLSDQSGPGGSEPPPDVDALLGALESYTRVALAALAGPAGGGAPRGRVSSLAAAERVLSSAIFGEKPGTLATTAAETQRVARTIRDWISADTWRAVAELDEELNRPHVVSSRSGRGTLGAMVALLDRAVMILAALSSLAADSMTRGHAWRFLDMGRRLERSIHLVSLLRSALDPSPEGALLQELLHIADGSMTYRRRYLATLQVAPVVDLLLTDETNPRSVVFQVATLGKHIDALPRDSGRPRTSGQTLVLTALAELRLADVAELCRSGERSERAQARPIVGLLDRVGALFPALSDALSGAYFNHAAVPRQMNGAPRSPPRDTKDAEPPVAAIPAAAPAVAADRPLRAT
jgi:uncharacterized circularly permuted ATP-grasp superfamily protein/uncharacterized alpha-E superfamily protein